MKKTSLFLGLLVAVTVTLSGCGSEEDKLADLAAGMLCLANDAMSEMLTATDPAEMEAKGKEMEEKMQKMLEDAGYADDSEAEAAFDKIADKEAWAEKVKEKAKSKCDAPDYLVESFVSEMQ